MSAVGAVSSHAAKSLRRLRLLH